MRDVALSVIIPTLPDRWNVRERLLERLGTHDGAEVIVTGLAKPEPMGTNVQRGYEMAAGHLSVIVDDDDMVPEGFLSTLVHLIDAYRPDCIGYNVARSWDGRPAETFECRLEGPLPPWGGRSRCIVPKTPHLTSAGRQVGFGDHYQADQDWCHAIRPLLSTTIALDYVMYLYLDGQGEFGGSRSVPDLEGYSSRMAAKKASTTKAPVKKAPAHKTTATKKAAAPKTEKVVEPRPDPLTHIVQQDPRLTRLPQDRNGHPAYAVSTGGFIWQDGNKWGYSVGDSPYMNASEPVFDTQKAALKALTG